MRAIVVTKYLRGASTNILHSITLVCFCINKKRSNINFVLYGIYYKCVKCYSIIKRKESDTIKETDQVLSYIEI